MAQARRSQSLVVSFFRSALGPILLLSIFGLLVVYIQLVLVRKLSAPSHRTQPFDGFKTLDLGQAQTHVVEEIKEESHVAPPALHTCPSEAREVFPEVIFAARYWLKPWSSNTLSQPDWRISEQSIDDFFAWLIKEGFAVARIRVTNGVLAKPIMVKGLEKADGTYVKRVARWFLLFKRLDESRRLPRHLDVLVSTEVMPIAAHEMDFVNRPPLFAYFGYPGFLDIPLPSYELYGRLGKWGRHTVLEHTWLSRNPKVFWRGRPVGSPNEGEADYWRHYAGAALVRLGTQYPELVDAKFEDCRAHGCSEVLWQEVYQSTLTNDRNSTYTDYLQHKYVVDLEDRTLQSSFSLLLSTMAVVLKPSSTRIEFFNEFFIPYMHYVPIDADGTNWRARIEELDRNVEQASEISRAATIAFEEYVANERWLDYAWALLTVYAQLLQTR